MSDLGDSDLPDSPDPLSSSPPWADQFDFDTDNFDTDNDNDIDLSDVDFPHSDIDVHHDGTSIELDEDEDEDEAEEDGDEDLDESDEENGEERNWVGAEDIDGLDDDDLGFFGGVGEVVELDFEDAFGDHFDEDGGFPENFIHLDAENHFNAIHHILIQHLGQQLGHGGHQLLLRPHSPMNPPQQADPGPLPGFGAAPRRRGRDQLVQVEMGGHAGAVAARQGEQERERRRPPPDIIDLTGDDDADMPHRLNAAPSQPGNLRRQRSQPQNGPPRLNRSDNSYMDDQQVIILSSSDDEEQSLHAAPRRSANNNPHQGAHGSRNIFDPPHHHPHHHHPHNPNHPNRPHDLLHSLHHNNHNNHNNHNHHNHHNNAGRGARSARFGDQPRQPSAANVSNGNQDPVASRISQFSQLMQNLPFFHLINNNPPPGMAARNDRPDDDIVITGTRPAHVGPGANRQQFVGLAPIHLDYGAHPFAGLQNLVPPVGAGIQSKPPHEPPKPARPGFTRDTGEDVVAICPSCNQELAYDPEGESSVPATPAKKTSRSRKAQAEHHFWAVKACGHVSKDTYTSLFYVYAVQGKR